MRDKRIQTREIVYTARASVNAQRPETKTRYPRHPTVLQQRERPFPSTKTPPVLHPTSGSSSPPRRDRRNRHRHRRRLRPHLARPHCMARPYNHHRRITRHPVHDDKQQRRPRRQQIRVRRNLRDVQDVRPVIVDTVRVVELHMPLTHVLACVEKPPRESTTVVLAAKLCPCLTSRRRSGGSRTRRS